MGCRASVEAKLQEVVGARYIAVNLGKQSATVIFDPTKTDIADLRTAIGQAGYTPKSETIVDG